MTQNPFRPGVAVKQQAFAVDSARRLGRISGCKKVQNSLVMKVVGCINSQEYCLSPAAQRA